MQLQLFFRIFALIFLLELGDKTQLAAMASAADQPHARMTILVAAALALVASTLVAVMLGAQLTRWIPERTIKLTAGFLFLLFGILILREGFSSPKAVAAEETAPAALGVVGRRLLSEVVELERLAFEDYAALAEQTADPALKHALLEIAAEERRHHEQWRNADHATIQALAPRDEFGTLPARQELAHHAAASDRPVLEHAIEHELGMAAFYRQIGRIALLPSLKPACEALARAEEAHAERLRAFL